MANTYDSSKDPYAQRSVSVDSQGRSAVAVSPSNTVDISVGGAYAKALYIGVAGNITVLPVNATDDTAVVLFSNHPVGYMPMQVRRVMATGTSASGIVALGA